MISTHGGFPYSCDNWNFQTPENNSLKKHKLSTHGMITQPLPCDQCEYTAKRQYNLRIPKESHHEGILYSCEHCNFEAKSASIF